MSVMIIHNITAAVGKMVVKVPPTNVGLHRGKTDVPWNSDRRSITQQIEKLDLID